MLLPILALGGVYSYVRYKAKTNVDKISTTLMQLVSFVYITAAVLLVFLFLIHFFSFINGLPKLTTCVDEDETCVLISPYNSHQANYVFNKLPVSYRTSRAVLMEYIEEWAQDKTNWAEIDKDKGEVRSVIITYLTFINDLWVHARVCEQNKEFVSVIVHAQLRIGYKDFGNELEEKVRGLYEFLKTKYKPTEYSYRFCVSKEEINDII